MCSELLQRPITHLEFNSLPITTLDDQPLQNHCCVQRENRILVGFTNTQVGLKLMGFFVQHPFIYRSLVVVCFNDWNKLNMYVDIKVPTHHSSPKHVQYNQGLLHESLEYTEQNSSCSHCAVTGQWRCSHTSGTSGRLQNRVSLCHLYTVTVCTRSSHVWVIL